MSEIKKAPEEYSMVLQALSAVFLVVFAGGAIAIINTASNLQKELVYLSILVTFFGLVFFGVFFGLMLIEKHLRELIKR